MARKYQELRDRMSPKRQAEAGLRAREMMAEMLLSEIRKQAGLTQTGLARTLGIAQPSLSKLEAQDDMHVSTLRRIIHALGGDLELVAHLPSGTVRLTQFKDGAQPA